jgi:hypothetical protein
MSLLVTILKPPRRYVRVHLGGRQALVAEKFLHAANIRTGIEHVCGEAVAKRVRASPRVEARRFQVLLQ